METGAGKDTLFEGGHVVRDKYIRICKIFDRVREQRVVYVLSVPALLSRSISLQTLDLTERRIEMRKSYASEHNVP